MRESAAERAAPDDEGAEPEDPEGAEAQHPPAHRAKRRREDDAAEPTDAKLLSMRKSMRSSHELGLPPPDDAVPEAPVMDFSEMRKSARVSDRAEAPPTDAPAAMDFSEMRKSARAEAPAPTDAPPNADMDLSAMRKSARAAPAADAKFDAKADAKKANQKGQIEIDMGGLSMAERRKMLAAKLGENAMEGQHHHAAASSTQGMTTDSG